jgi:hypothetical protein
VPVLPAIDVNFKPFSSDIVHNVLIGLDASKSPGPDNIPARLLKTLADSLAKPVCHLFNQSISSGNVPAIWKTSTITPLPKKPNTAEPKNFRPIALTPILAKCLEKLIAPYITSSFRDNNQYAYKEMRGTDDAMLVLLDSITLHLDKAAKNFTRGIFIDFSSAFNTIDPNILTKNMITCNIHSNIISWVHDFCKDVANQSGVTGDHPNPLLHQLEVPRDAYSVPYYSHSTHGKYQAIILTYKS